MKLAVIFHNRLIRGGGAHHIGNGAQIRLGYHLGNLAVLQGLHDQFPQAQLFRSQRGQGDHGRLKGILELDFLRHGGEEVVFHPFVIQQLQGPLRSGQFLVAADLLNDAAHLPGVPLAQGVVPQFLLQRALHIRQALQQKGVKRAALAV